MMFVRAVCLRLQVSYTAQRILSELHKHLQWCYRQAQDREVDG